MNFELKFPGTIDHLSPSSTSKDDTENQKNLALTLSTSLQKNQKGELSGFEIHLKRGDELHGVPISITLPESFNVAYGSTMLRPERVSGDSTTPSTSSTPSSSTSTSYTNPLLKNS